MLRRTAARQINNLPTSAEGSNIRNKSKPPNLPLHHKQRQDHSSNKKNSFTIASIASDLSPSNGGSVSATNLGGKTKTSMNRIICFLFPFLLYIFVGYTMISYYFGSSEGIQDELRSLNLDTLFSSNETSLSTSYFNNDEHHPSVIEDIGSSLNVSSHVHAPVRTVRSMKELILDGMKEKLELLPSPEWPQLDHRTAEAMASGVVLGVENYTAFNFNHTIVTAYYEFESKHSVHQYTKWMIGLFQTSDPIIAFVEPKSKWLDIVQELRQHAPTLLVPMKFEDLVMSTTFTKEFWDYQHSIDTEAKIHKASGVYKIWNEKLIFIQNAIQLNPFHTNGFAWMDIGYFRQLRDAPELGTPIIRLDYNAEGVSKEKVLVMHVRNDPLEAVARVNVAGNCFFGTAEAFLKFYTHYYTTFWDWISVHNKFIGSDQFVMTETCRRYASGCYPYFAGRFKSWFALAAVIMKKKKLSEVSQHYLFLDKPPASLPQLPHGDKISYCNGHVVLAKKCH